MGAKRAVNRGLLSSILFFSTCLSFIFGYALANLNTSISTLAVQMEWCGNEWQADCDEARHKGAFLAYVVMFGAGAGCVLGGPLVAYGRLFAIKATSAVYFACSLLAVFGGNFTTLLVARLFTGFAVGFTTVCVPMYISELSPAEERGFNVTLSQLMITIGIFVAICTGFLLDAPDGTEDYRVPEFTSAAMKLIMGLPLIPSAGCFIFFTMYPLESPTWLLKHRLAQRAMQTLEKVYADKETAHLELNQMVAGNTHDSPREQAKSVSVFAGLFMPKYRTVAILGCSIGVFGQLCGINVFMASCASVLSGVGIPPHQVMLLSAAMGLLNVLVTIPSFRRIQRCI
eukprot:Selendium_serpulae@DN8105_c0_g1_i1.p1